MVIVMCPQNLQLREHSDKLLNWDIFKKCEIKHLLCKDALMLIFRLHSNFSFKNQIHKFTLLVRSVDVYYLS